MGRVAVISDIHSNLEALTVVLDHIHSQGVNTIFCLGDIVGYNANPKECLDLIRARGIQSPQGNHDRYTCGADEPRLRESAQRAIEFGLQQLSQEDIVFLENLPTTWLLTPECLMVHGSPVDPDEYIVTDADASSILDYLRITREEIAICFHGHTHIPMIACPSWIRRDFQERKTVQLQRGGVYLMNPGSVGQPRDGCPLSSYLVFDTDAWAVTFWRLDYDLATTQQKIHDCGLAPGLATRLAGGR